MGRNCVFWTKEDIAVMNRERQGGIRRSPETESRNGRKLNG